VTVKLPPIFFFGQIFLLRVEIKSLLNVTSSLKYAEWKNTFEDLAFYAVLLFFKIKTLLHETESCIKNNNKIHLKPIL